MYKFEFRDPAFLPHLGCNIDISLNQGDILVILGANGLGKTTLMRKISQLPTAKETSYIEQMPMDLFFERQIHVVREILINARPHLLTSDHDLLWHQSGLAEKANRFLSELSGGETQLLKLYLGLIKTADLYLLDEPTQYLDQDKKKFLAEVIETRRRAGASFIIVEHDQQWLNSGWRVEELINSHGQLVKGQAWTI